jgi:hypothetical protein
MSLEGNKRSGNFERRILFAEKKKDQAACSAEFFIVIIMSVETQFATMGDLVLSYVTLIKVTPRAPSFFR